MSKKGKKKKARPLEARFVSSLRDFMTPGLFRQIQKLLPARFKGSRRKGRRWSIHPLLFVLLCMTWCTGDSQPERFESARAFCIACHPKRRRPGKTFTGYQQALNALPTFALRLIAALFRRRLLQRLQPQLQTDGWTVCGCDGSRVKTARVKELEDRLGDPGGDSCSGRKAPQVWLTAIVLLASGVPWSWMVGKGDASERQHLALLIPTLIEGMLLVADAGYQGYQLARQLADAEVCFLIRVSTQTIFYTEDREIKTNETDKGSKEMAAEELPKWTEGEVYYWPQEAQQKKEKPVRVRLIRIQGKKQDVWLVTNVLDKEKLTIEMAGKFYRMRWENEGYFRSYKQTLKKVKLAGRTVKAVHREVLGSMLAVQVLLAQGAIGAILLGKRKAANSARQLVWLARREIQAASLGKQRNGFLKRAAACDRENRDRTSSKEVRPWPGRKPAKTIQPPRIRQLDDDAKLFLLQSLGLAA